MWKRIQKNVQKRTLVFVGFMLGFLILLIGLTYYSHVAYFERLPRVVTVMPEQSDVYQNGRYLYIVPEQAVQEVVIEGKLIVFVYTARYYSDILGERNLVTMIQVREEEKLENGMVIVDGIVRLEPVITEGQELLYSGQAVLLQDTE